MDNYYNWFKAFHMIFVISWMAGMFYLPRLFAYHAEVESGSNEDKRFKIMEKRLLKIIINPAMILSIVFGFLIAHIYGFVNLGLWFYLKMALVLLMILSHAFFVVCYKNFALGKNKFSSKFYKTINEIPPVLMVFIVILVIVKPFE